MDKAVNESVKPIVSFMIIGAQKSGTTALAKFLGQHPDIYVPPIKEVHLFDAEDWPGFSNVENINNAYTRVFDNYKGEGLVGEATPIYLYWSDTLKDIYRYNPNMKIIVLLRDPVERAISHYRMEKARGTESLPLLLALLIEPYRLWRSRDDRSLSSPRRLNSYFGRGKYSVQLVKLFNIFPEKNIFLLKTSELQDCHEEVLTRTFDFLNVDNIGGSIPAEKVFGGPRSVKKYFFCRLLLGLLYSKELSNLSRIRSVSQNGRKSLP